MPLLLFTFSIVFLCFSINSVLFAIRWTGMSAVASIIVQGGPGIQGDTYRGRYRGPLYIQGEIRGPLYIQGRSLIYTGGDIEVPYIYRGRYRGPLYIQGEI